MSGTEVVEEFRRLPREEQRKVIEVLQGEFEEELSPEQVAEFERRAERLRRNPETGIPWEQVRAERKERLVATRPPRQSPPGMMAVAMRFASAESKSGKPISGRPRSRSSAASETSCR